MRHVACCKVKRRVLHLLMQHAAFLCLVRGILSQAVRMKKMTEAGMASSALSKRSSSPP